MKRETLKRLNVAPGLWVNLSPAEREDILDSHAAQARKIRELTARLKVASRAVGLEIAPEHDGYPGSPEQALVYAARDACDLTKPLKKGKAKR